MAKKSEIKDTDLGLNKALRSLKELKGLKTRVGVQKGTPGPPDADIDMAGLAAIHVLGSPEAGIPARDFMSITFAKTTKARNRLVDSLATRVQESKLKPKRAIAILGAWYEGEMKKEIRQLSDPPNAPATIAKKGSSNPLVDEGRLIGSIRHVEEL